MNLNAIWIVAVFAISVALQYVLNLQFSKEFISTLLTVFALFFGFYITSFAVFSSSKYLSILYGLQDKNDNRMTLLDVLLREFKRATWALLTSIFALVVVYVCIENEWTCAVNYFSYLIWGVLPMNIIYLYNSIKKFILITRKSAIENQLSLYK